jgi:two-component system chemotaxis response regulator CheB
MIADDSAVIRGLIARTLESDPEIEIVATVPDGRAAIAALERCPVDVIVLDVEMPNMDGLTAIPHLLKVAPGVKIVMASTLTLRNADITLKALSAGAADYIPKPTATRDMMGAASFNRDLVAKVKQLAAPRARPSAPTAPGRVPPAAVPPGAAAAPAAAPAAVPARPLPAKRNAPTIPPHAIAIGSSTGGPQALFQVLKHLAPAPTVPVLITQHMPPTFTTILADHITRQCGVKAVEATDGLAVEAGTIYVAPGNFHMTVDASKIIRLNQDPPENYCRPSVDPMLRSLVAVYGPRLVTLILTGMGQDGLKGCQSVVEAGGAVFAQDEATSVVWGMPGAVATAGLCFGVLPLAEIGPRLRPYAYGKV